MPILKHNIHFIFNPPTHRDERVEHLSYLPTYLPNFLSSFLPFFLKKQTPKRRFTSSFLLATSQGYSLKLPALLGTYFF
jgi:hypothetical protein